MDAGTLDVTEEMRDVSLFGMKAKMQELQEIRLMFARLEELNKEISRLKKLVGEDEATGDEMQRTEF